MQKSEKTILQADDITEPRAGNKLRVALCISGQMRGFEKAAPSVIEHLIKPLDADVFIHTWGEIGNSVNEHLRTLPGPFGHYLPREMHTNNKVFHADFPTFSDQITGTDMVDPNRLKELYNPVEMVVEESPKPENFDKFFGFSVPKKLLNALPKAQWSRQMFYKIMKCNDLKIAAEDRGNFKYDLVIRLRPDLVVGNSIPKSHLDDLTKLYYRVRKIDPNYQISDQYFYGSSAVMDVACQTFNRIPDLWEEYRLGDVSHKFYNAEALSYLSVTRNSNITLVPYRTEPANIRSAFQLVSHGLTRLTYPEAKDALLTDINGIKGSHQARMKLALGRSLATYVRGAIKADKSEANLSDLLKTIAEFETRSGTSGDFATSLVRVAQANLKGARQAAEKALAQEPSSSEILVHLADIAHKQKNPHDTVRYAERVIALPDEFKRQNRSSKWLPFNLLGTAHEILGDYEAALSAYMASFSLNPKRSASCYRVGKMLYRLGQYDQSLWFLRHAQTLDAKHHAAAYFEGRSLYKVGEYMDARAIALKFVGTNLETGGAKTKFLGLLALVQFHTGFKAAAEKTIDVYLETGALHEDEVVELSKVLISLDRVADAKSFAKKGLEEHPDNKLVHESVGWLIK